eukprot:637869-Pelagomonas_calceolata.AAC.2
MITSCTCLLTCTGNDVEGGTLAGCPSSPRPNDAGPAADLSCPLARSAPASCTEQTSLLSCADVNVALFAQSHNSLHQSSLAP